MDNASDRKQIRRAEKAAKLAERNRSEVIVALASHESGRKYLWDRIADAGVFTTIYSDSPQRMAFNEGLRSGGLALLADFMQFAPDNFIQAMREENGRRTTDAAIDRNEASGEDGEPTRGEEPRREPEGLRNADSGAVFGEEDRDRVH